MGSGAGPIEVGLNRKENHDRWVTNLRRHIELASEAGVPSVICFSGNRQGMSDEEGLENCVIGVKQVVGLAEKKGINVCMSLLIHLDGVYAPILPLILELGDRRLEGVMATTLRVMARIKLSAVSDTSS